MIRVRGKPFVFVICDWLEGNRVKSAERACQKNCGKMSFLNSLKKTTNFNLQLVRNYAFKSDLKIKWNRPEKLPCFHPEKSGDLAKLTKIPGSEVALDFKDSRELPTADEAVKTLFTLDYQPRFKTSDSHRDQMVRKVQRHEQDFGSIEAKCKVFQILFQLILIFPSSSGQDDCFHP